MGRAFTLQIGSMKKVIIIGGGGYVGSELTRILLEQGYKVVVYDLFIYGNTLPKNQNLEIVNGDIRNIDLLNKTIKDVDNLIHLACISNDPSFDLNPDLGKSINFDPFEDLVKISKENGVKRFIYASSSSVYGIKSETNVDETFSLQPLTDYSKFKAMCEEVLFKYKNNEFVCSCIRPATVCGYSRRQRFDLVVNILTNHAYNNKEIKIFGGNQLRPNIHITDMCNSYLCLLEADKNLINGEAFNVGFENHSVSKLGDIINQSLGGSIKILNVPSNDDRSYHISSKKISNILGFAPNFTIQEAVADIKRAFEKKLFKDPLSNEMYFNIKRMKSINLV